jgi:hypothetical protein
MKNKGLYVPIWIIAVVVIIVIIIIAFVFSLGSLKTEDFNQLPEEFKDSKEEAKRKHERLRLLLEKQEKLKTKLDKWFKIIYFFVRLILVVFWFLIIGTLYYFNFIHNLGDLLNFSEALILICITINFLTFGTISNLKSFIDLIKTRIENWVYGKNITIDQKIEINKNELIKLKKEIEN